MPDEVRKTTKYPMRTWSHCYQEKQCFRKERTVHWVKCCLIDGYKKVTIGFYNMKVMFVLVKKEEL